MAYTANQTIGQLETLDSSTINTSDLVVVGDVSDTNRAKAITVGNLDTYLSATTKTLANKTLTSPVLTTPQLGTPASGVLTNATGLPVATGISGLGTGAATALAINIGSAGAFTTFNGAGGTPSALVLTNATGLLISGLVNSTLLALGLGSIELGHATDTTIARVSAGVISVEGATVITTAPGTSGNVLTSNGTIWTSAAASGGASTPVLRASTAYETAARFASTLVGSGTNTLNERGLVTATGGTSSSSARYMYSPTGEFGGHLYLGSPVTTFSLMTSNIDTIATASSFFGLATNLTVSGSGHTFTVAHIGFKILNASTITSLFATQADGTTENASAALTTVANTNNLDLIFKVIGTASVDYYWRKNGGALSSASNLTSNIPASVSDVRIQTSVSNHALSATYAWIVGSASYER